MKFTAAVVAASFPAVSGRIGHPSYEPVTKIVYPLKQRVEQEASTVIFTLAELSQYKLTYSDDSKPKSLAPFMLELFETDGDLPIDPTIGNVEMALYNFLMPELQAVYQSNTNSIEDVSVDITSQQTISESLPPTSSRYLQDARTGTELTTAVEVTFDTEPSPALADVEQSMATILSDLTYFYSNLTAIGDPNLSRVTYAKTVHEFVPVDNPGRDPVFTPIEQGTPRSNNSGDDMPYEIIIPCVAGGLAMAALAMWMNKKHRSHKRALRSGTIRRRDVNIFYGETDDAFSFEAALAESPYQKKSSQALLKTQSSLDRRGVLSDSSKSVDSDIFSGLDSPAMPSPSPRGGQSVFSFFSGFASLGAASAATVQASNLSKNAKTFDVASEDAATAQIEPGTIATVGAAAATVLSTRAMKSPRRLSNRMGPLFTFSEETDEDMRDIGINTAPSDEEHENELPFDEHSPNKMKVKKSEILPELNLSRSDDSSEFGPQPATSMTTPQSTTGRSMLSSDDESGYNGAESTGLASPDSNSMKNADTRSPEPSTTSGTSEIKEKETVGWDLTIVPGAAMFSAMTGAGKKQKGAKAYASDSEATSKKKSSRSDSGYRTEPEQTSPSDKMDLDWSNADRASSNAAQARAFVGAANKNSSLDKVGRRHTKSTTGDGTTDYQQDTMEPQEWSVASYEDGVSLPDSIEETEPPKKSMPSMEAMTPRSEISMDSSAFGASPTSMASSTDSMNRQLITDLVWLEKKIAGVTKNLMGGTTSMDAETTAEEKTMGIQQSDSLSFASVDASENASIESANEDGKKNQVQSIVCKDCFAPPGKLKIVIHSTKDGPAVHTVKKGSSLEGHIFPGDLIISVDNVDTRSYSAEQVMKMMTAKTRFERKITVLHFETTSM